MHCATLSSTGPACSLPRLGTAAQRPASSLSAVWAPPTALVGRLMSSPCTMRWSTPAVLQAEGWVLPSWFQLGTRKRARGIFSPGFWRSQRAFILRGAGRSGTMLPTLGSGLWGCKHAGHGVREWGRLWP